MIATADNTVQMTDDMRTIRVLAGGREFAVTYHVEAADRPGRNGLPPTWYQHADKQVLDSAALALIESWDLTDDAGPVPVSREGFERVTEGELRAVVQRVILDHQMREGSP